MLYELANRTNPTATEIGRHLNLDAGYLSRLLRTLEQKALIERSGSRVDGRQSHLRLTAKGRNTFTDLDKRARTAISTLLERYDDLEQRRVLNAMRAIETVMGPGAKPAAPVIFRDPQPGDMGLIVCRQALLYAQEYGWNQEYEALIAHIVGDFAERKGVAKLRLLYVEPVTRGLGVGRRLVDECTSFARQAGYRTITLWTNSVLTSARRIYEAEGYRLVGEEPQHNFGHDLVSQTWELSLKPAA